MLKADCICKTYDSGKKTALENFSLEISASSICGLLGPNGAGKTTFLRILNQILSPDSGHITIEGEPLSPKHIKTVGYMPEERGLYKNMSIGEQLVYFGALKGMNKQEAKREAKKWFDLLEMELWWKKKVGELSKGMAQKVQFVVTVLHRPTLLIFDEPFSGFDPLNANVIRDQILKLRDQGCTIILSTHRMESVEELCDSVVLVHHAHKILDGKLREIQDQYRQNIYRIHLSSVEPLLLKEFMLKYKTHHITAKNDICSFEIHEVVNPNKILSDLLKVGSIISFQEKIPSMNEVFIRAINSKTQT
ncbi:MAG: ABC transporter ATP-binding protein [Bergeyella sp.]|nr:ABC transporter ATP-binding protein [Bergeyella sp.]